MNRRGAQIPVIETWAMKITKHRSVPTKFKAEVYFDYAEGYDALTLACINGITFVPAPGVARPWDEPRKARRR